MRRFLQSIAAQPWAIDYSKAMEILGYLEARAAGQIEAREIGEREFSEIRETRGGIAVIRIHGAITNRAGLMDSESLGLGASAERIEGYLRTAYDDDGVKAIVLDINSPGGSVAGTPELAATVREIRDNGDKPIIAQVNAVAASAAYWIAAQATEIVAVPSSEIGSIGVFAVHEEVSRMLDAEGITDTIIRAGKYKAEANPFEPLGDDAKGHIQSQVGAIYEMFIDAVAGGRGVGAQQVKEKYGQGRTLLAQDALRVGMIDGIRTMQETLNLLGAGSRDQRPGGMSRNVAAKKLQLAKLR